MTRYYYTDPIAAAWMVRHHDLKVTTDVIAGNGKREQKPIPLWAWGRVIENWAMSAYSERFYISPESESLLEPRIGDLVTVNGGQDAHIAFHQDFVDALKANYGQFAGPIKIIQRDGKAFHWPQKESEEA